MLLKYYECYFNVKRTLIFDLSFIGKVQFVSSDFDNEKLKTVPTPGVLNTSIVSPCASIICFTMAKPKPEPPFSRLRDESTR